MNPTFLALLLGMFSFLLFLLAHIIIWRSPLGRHKGVGLLTMIAAISYLGTFATEAALFVNGKEFGWHWWLSLPFYLFLVMLYFHFYVGIDRSVSLRIVGELVHAQKGMRIEKIHARYSPAWMLQARCDLLVRHGWLTQNKGAYSCTKKGHLLAKAAYHIQRWYRLEATG